MKATGIVRRIDDLGRVVIPKEIRRTMRIREGDPLLTSLTPIDQFRGRYIIWREEQNRSEIHSDFVASITAFISFCSESFSKNKRLEISLNCSVVIKAS